MIVKWSEIADMANATIVVKGQGEITGIGSDGLPDYGPDVERYNAPAIVWRANGNQAFARDKKLASSTHRVLLNPAKLTGSVLPSDKVTYLGKDFDVLTSSENILNKGVIQFEIGIKDENA